MTTKKDNTDKYDWKITVTKKGKKYDTDKYEGHTEGPWYRMHSNDTIRSEPMGDNAEAHLFDIVGATTVDAELAADAPRILQALIDEQAEVERLRLAFITAILKLKMPSDDDE